MEKLWTEENLKLLGEICFPLLFNDTRLAGPIIFQTNRVTTLVDYNFREEERCSRCVRLV